MTKKIVVFAAHPDDEVLGCGGTIAKHVEAGDEVTIVIAAEGLTSRTSNRNVLAHTEEFKKLYEDCRRANAALGVEKIEFLGFPDNRMDSLDLLDVVKKVEEIINRYSPEIIYVHHHGDLNVDHKVLNQALITACRPQPGACTKQIYYYEVPSASGWHSQGDSNNSFQPNYFKNIDKQLEKKMLALAAYESEMRPFPHARSIDAVKYLAYARGNHVGYVAAEAFVVGRILED